MMGETHWEGAIGTLRRRLERRTREVPEFSDSTIHIVAGLLLPIWKRLPNESTRVYRLQTDEGERIVGRKGSRPPGRPTPPRPARLLRPTTPSWR